MAQESNPFDEIMRRRGLAPGGAAQDPRPRKASGEAAKAEAEGNIAPRAVKAAVDKDEAGAANTRTTTKVNERELALPNLSPGAQEADKKFADVYVGWRKGGVGAYNKNLDQIQTAINLLRSSKNEWMKPGDQISGPWFGLLPAFIRKRVSPSSKNVHDDIYSAIQASLRQTLGAQFTQQEGEKLLAASFDKDLPEQDNLTRAERLLDQLRSEGVNTESMARYWEAPGPSGLPRQTLQGYTPADVGEIKDLFPSSSAPSDDKPWLSPQQEEAIVAYANGETPTAQGYVDLLQRFAKENGLQPFDPAEALRHGKEIEDFRKQGMTFSPGVMYDKGFPEPGEEGLTGSVTDDGTGTTVNDGGPTWGDTALDAGKNLIPSTAQLLGDTAGGVMDIMSDPRAAVGPFGAAAVIGDQLSEIGKSALGAFGVTDADPTLAEAIGKHYADRYGGVDNFKRTLAEDPAGTLADLSTVVTGFGGAGVKTAQLAGTAGKVSRGVRAVGRAMDPINLTAGRVEGITALASRYLPDGVKSAGSSMLHNLTQKYPAYSVAFPSGIGGGTVEEAVGSGRQRSLKGPNPRSKAFTDQMRDKAPASDVLAHLDAGVTRLREDASLRYQRDMAPITADSTQIDFAPIEAEIARLRPPGFGRYGTKRPMAADAAWAEADSMVAQHRDLIASDPATYATPAALDEFKKRLYDTLSGYVEGNDNSAMRIANGANRAVRGAIAAQAPDYARVMKDYADAQEHLTQIRGTLTSGGKNRNTDASIRKLQSVLRRNDPGHAGQLMDDVGAQPNSELLAAVSGRAGEAPFPGGLRGAMGAGLTLSPSGISAMSSGMENLGDMLPAQALALASMSPRGVSELSYGFGRGIGAGEAAAKGAWGAYEAAPATTLAGIDAAATGHRISEEERRKRELLKRYGINVPSLGGLEDLR